MVHACIDERFKPRYYIISCSVRAHLIYNRVWHLFGEFDNFQLIFRKLQKRALVIVNALRDLESILIRELFFRCEVTHALLHEGGH